MKISTLIITTIIISTTLSIDISKEYSNFIEIVKEDIYKLTPPPSPKFQNAIKSAFQKNSKKFLTIAPKNIKTIIPLIKSIIPFAVDSDFEQQIIEKASMCSTLTSGYFKPTETINSSVIRSGLARWFIHCPGGGIFNVAIFGHKFEGGFLPEKKIVTKKYCRYGYLGKKNCKEIQEVKEVTREIDEDLIRYTKKYLLGVWAEAEYEALEKEQII